MSVKPITNDSLDIRCSYLVDTYISADAKFPPEMWVGLNDDFLKKLQMHVNLFIHIFVFKPKSVHVSTSCNSLIFFGKGG